MVVWVGKVYDMKMHTHNNSCGGNTTTLRNNDNNHIAPGGPGELCDAERASECDAHNNKTHKKIRAMALKKRPTKKTVLIRSYTVDV